MCALALAIVAARCPDGALCTLTADHVIGERARFLGVLEESFRLALAEDVLLTIGISPVTASTGFGYIETGGSRQDGGVPGGGEATVEFLAARRFVEKPDVATAQAYVEAGNYYWNSGMFIWSVAAIRSALARHQPGLLAMADRMQAVVDTPDFYPCMATEYGKLEKISVDYAIMEKVDNIVMARATFLWDDIGSWPALENHFEPDEGGNRLIGRCEQIDAANNVVVSNGRLTALIGVRDLVVVQAEGATLICPKDRAQDVKQMVVRLKERGTCEDVL